MRFGISSFILLLAAIPLAIQAQQKLAPTSTLSGAQKQGQKVFQQNCSVCHMPPAHSDKSVGRILNKQLVEKNEDAIRETIANGLPGAMPGWKHTLRPNQIDEIIAYLKSVDGPAPSPATAVLSSGKQAEAEDCVITGSVNAASREKMEGVTVSAKREGRTITTSVFTDKQGNYYFPPMAEGKYRIWAQAIGYETGRGEVELNSAIQKKDFVIKETKDFISQLTGGQYVAALPVDTPAHRRMKDIFAHNCTTCHTAALALQNRFDEKGWEAIISLMSRIGASGRVNPQSDPPDPFIDHYKNELAAYLAEVRGPGDSPMKFKVPPRPSEEATLPVVYEYDIPLEEAGGYTVLDGSDWSLGTPSNSFGVRGIHDATIDLLGNIWFTYSVTSANRTYGKIDSRTGEVTNFKVAGSKGMAATSHGIMRGPDGDIWINVIDSASAVSSEKGRPALSLGRIDPKTGKIEIYTPPPGMTGVGGHVDWDGKGFLWAATTKGSIRFDPETREFQEFRSLTPTRSYGVTADRNGNGWWAEILIDKVGHSDVKTGKSLELSIPKTSYFSEALTQEDLKFYEKNPALDSATGPPWGQGPRRLGADRNGNDIWVGLFAGRNLMRVNIENFEYKIYPAPGSDLGTYMPVVDNSHNVWLDIQGSDSVEKLDPKTGKWTRYDWPTRGAAPRNIALLDQDGIVQVICAYWGTSRVGRIVTRTEKDLQALKMQVQTMARK